MKADLVLKNAKLVSPRGIIEAGLAVKDGVITVIARDIHLPQGQWVIDAKGKYVLPGVLDGHAHTFLPPETPASGMKAAAKGGITTMLEMPGTQMGCFNLEQFEEKKTIMERNSYVDFCIHGGCASGFPEGTLTDMWKNGVTGLKFFISSAGPKWPQTFDGEVIQRFRELSRCNGLALIHAENDAIIRDNEKRLREEGRKDFSAHLEWRPPIAEIEAGKRMIDYLEAEKCRGLIVHTSVPETIWYSVKAKMRGVQSYIETCPQYLYLSEDDVKQKGPWVKFAPPVRSKQTQFEIRRLLREGWIDTVATDHAPYSKERKENGLDDIFKAPNGIPGLETFLPLLLNAVNEDWLSLERVAEVSAENPAKIYGIYPKKGCLIPGSDGDFVIVDMKKKIQLSDEEQISACGWTPFSGMNVVGSPVLSVIRGIVVMEDGIVQANRGQGKFISRDTI